MLGCLLYFLHDQQKRTQRKLILIQSVTLNYKRIGETDEKITTLRNSA
jgi:hypothetical protein